MNQKKPQINDISNIADLTKKYKKGELEQLILELRALCRAQDVTIQQMHEALADKDNQIELLKSSPSAEIISGQIERIMPSNEEIIVELQLEKIRSKAGLGELTLEEARKFEIFTKYKQNKKDNSIVVTAARKASPEETVKLLNAASQNTTRDLKQDE